MIAKTKFRYLLAVIASITLFSSCVNDINLKDVDDTISMNGAVVFPLAQSTITLKDFVDELNIENMTVNSNNILTVNYKPSTSYSFNLNISPSDVSINTTTPATLSSKAGTTISTATFNSLSPSQIAEIDLCSLASANITRLDSIYISNATLSFTLNTNINFAANQLQLTVTPAAACFPSLSPTTFANVRNGSVCTIPLTNCWIKPQSSKISFSIATQATSGNIYVPASPSLNSSAALKNINFKYAFGQFAYNLASQTGTFDLGFLNDVISQSSYLPFQNPSFKLTCYSNARIPMQLNIDYIKSYNNSTPSNVRYASFSGSTSTSQSFSKMPSAPGKNAIDSLIFNKANGNIDNLFTLPGINTIAYSFGAQSQTGGITNQFIMSKDTFTVSPSVNIPFAFNAGVNVQMADTLSLGSSFTDFLNKNDLQNVKLWLIANNFTSTKVVIGLTLLDANKQSFSTTQNLTLNTTLNINNTTGQANQTSTTTDQQLSLAYSAADLKKAQYIKLSYSLAGKDLLTSLTLTSTDFIKVKLCAYVKGNAKLNDN
jgi:hypothetical protein